MTLELSDLVVAKPKEIRVTPSFLKFIMSPKIVGNQPSLPHCLSVASNFTQLTGREMAISIYSELPKDPKTYKHIDRLAFTGKLAVPNIGDMHSVQMPGLDQQVYGNQVKRYGYSGDIKHPIWAPIIEIHTHPGSSKGTLPSAQDLRSAVYRFDEPITVGDTQIHIENPRIDVIATSAEAYPSNPIVAGLTRSSHLFHQFTGDHEAAKYLIKHYGDVYKDHAQDPSRFAQELQRSGAFKTTYFAPGELFSEEDFKETRGWRLNKKNTEKLSRKFPYTITMTRSSRSWDC